MPQKSIRLRLLLWFGFFLAVLIAGFGVSAYHLQKNARLEDIDAELARLVDLVGGAFRQGEHRPPPPPMDRPDFGGEKDFRHPPPHGMAPPLRKRTSLKLPKQTTSQFTNGTYFAVWGSLENTLLAQSSPEMNSIPLPTTSPRQTVLRYRTRDTRREAFQFTERQDCVLAGCDIAPILDSLRRFAWQIAAVGALVLLLGLGGGVMVSSLLLDSIRQISQTARRISDGNLSERISTRDMDRELGQLAEVLNATFARLEASFARQRQFTSDAAHELRTPLAVILSDTQTALRRERSAEEYRDTIQACEESAQKMRRLSESLLLLARMDSGADQGPPETVNLPECIQESLAQTRRQAEQRGIRMELDLQPAVVSGHPEPIGRVFTNLLVNAIDYNTPAGIIRLATRTEPAAVVATVADTGIGIPPEALPRIFDRFYRVSSARSPSEGHCGLGLAICKSILEAHGATIEAASQPGQGTTFTLRFPVGAPRPS